MSYSCFFSRIKLDTAGYGAISQSIVVKSAGGACSPFAVPRMNKYIQFWATVVRSRDKNEEKRKEEKKREKKN